MRSAILRLCLTGMLACLPLMATAAMSDSEAQSMVQTMLDDGRTAGEVITALMSDGRNLIDATIFGLVSGGESYRTLFSAAGISMSKSLSEAQSVAYALLATAGESGAVAATVDDALADYKSLIAPPSSYQGGGIAPGGGVSPSS